MRTRPVTAPGVAALALAAAVVPSVLAASPALATTPRPDAASTAYLGDVAGVPGTARVWALGLTASGGTQLLVHGGGRWTVAARPPVGKQGDLSAVAAGSADTVWTGGYEQVPASHGIPPHDVPFVGRWDSGSWDAQDLPATDGEVADVAASGANNAWAVGSMYTDGQYQADQWDGSSWTAVALPGTTTFVRVTTSGPKNAWALDDAGTVWSYDGSSWSRALTAPKNVSISSVSTAAADDTWVVGTDTKNSQFYAAHWNGTAWKQADIANPRKYGDLEDVSLAGGTGWAVAHVSSGKPGGDAWLMLHLVGGTWHTQQVTGIGSAQLNAVDAVSPSSAYAVGSGGNGGAYAQYAKGSWHLRKGPA